MPAGAKALKADLGHAVTTDTGIQGSREGNKKTLRAKECKEGSQNF